jgi:hypothetical protein
MILKISDSVLTARKLKYENSCLNLRQLFLFLLIVNSRRNDLGLFFLLAYCYKNLTVISCFDNILLTLKTITLTSKNSIF